MVLSSMFNEASIHSCFTRICDGEIQVPLLDEVGKQLLALPLRYGGQAIHDIGFEADISLVSTLHALSRDIDIVRRLPELHRKKFINAVQTAFINFCPNRRFWFFF